MSAAVNRYQAKSNNIEVVGELDGTFIRLTSAERSWVANI